MGSASACVRMGDMLIPENATTVDVPLRWSDMDAYAHVNNVQYLRLLEEARIIGFTRWFGRDRSVVGEGTLVARTEIEYRRPLEHRMAPVPISMWISKLGGASYDIAYVVHDDDVVYAVAETTMVAYDFTTEKPRRVADDDRALLERLRGPQAPLRRHQSGR